MCHISCIGCRRRVPPFFCRGGASITRLAVNDPRLSSPQAAPRGTQSPPASSRAAMALYSLVFTAQPAFKHILPKTIKHNIYFVQFTQLKSVPELRSYKHFTNIFANCILCVVIRQTLVHCARVIIQRSTRPNPPPNRIINHAEPPSSNHTQHRTTFPARAKSFPSLFIFPHPQTPPNPRYI